MCHFELAKHGGGRSEARRVDGPHPAGRPDERQRARRQKPLVRPVRTMARAACKSVSVDAEKRAIGLGELRAALSARHVRRIHPLQPQQPAFEVARQRRRRPPCRDGFERRHAQAVQPLVGIRIRRPLVDQLGEIVRCSPAPPDSAPRAATAPSRRSSGPPARAAPSRNTRLAPRSAVRARP